MPYCNQTDIEALVPQTRLIELTNDDPEGTSVDTDILEAVQSGADGIIDGYLASRYEVPLSTVPVMIRELSKDITAYKLYQRRTLEIPETISALYKNAIKLLQDISTGVVSLGVSSVPDNSKIRVNKTSDDRLFNKSTLDQY